MSTTAMTAPNTDPVDYAPPHIRRRADRPQLHPVPAGAKAVETTEPEVSGQQLSRNAAIVAEGIEKLQQSEARARTEATELRALNRQQEVKISEQRSEIERLTGERDAERSERIRLGSVIEQTAHGLSRAIEQPGQRENEQD